MDIAFASQAHARRYAQPIAPTVFNEEFFRAAQVTIAERSGSTQLLERTMHVSGSRAGSLLDLLQAAGVVAAPTGSPSRAVLVQDARYLERFR